MARRPAEADEHARIAGLIARVHADTAAGTGQAFLDALVASLAGALDASRVAIIDATNGVTPRAIASTPIDDGSPLAHAATVTREIDASISIEIAGAGALDADDAAALIDAFAPRVAAEIARTHTDAANAVMAERFHTLTEKGSDIVVHLRNGVIDWVSDNSEAITGLPVSDVIGQPMFGFIHPDDLVTAAAAAVAETEGRVKARFRVKASDDRWIWFESVGFRSTGGATPTSVHLLRDISEEIVGEEALRKMEERFRILTEQSDEVLIEFTDGQLTFVGPNIRELSGIAPEDVTGMKFIEMIHPDDLYLFANIAAGAFEGRFQLTFRVRIADGSWQYREATGVRQFVDGKPQALALLRNVSDRMETEASLRESEAHLRTVTESLPLGVYQTDTAGRCLYTNRRWREMAGLEAGAELGDGWAAAVHPDDREAVLAEWTATIAENRDFSMEFRFQRSDGSVSWVQSGATALRDEAGVVLGYVGNVEDITEKRAAMEALRESEELHRAVISVMADGIVVTDLAGTITTCNEAAQRILRMSADEIMGRTSDDSMWQTVRDNGEPFPAAEYPASITLRTGEPCESVVMGLRQPDGTTRWISINSRPMRARDTGALEAVVVSFADVTVQREAEEKLRAHASELEYLNAFLEQSEVALDAKSRELTRALEAAQEHARRDALTGVFNHGAITEQVVALAAEQDAVFALLMVDLDGMKAVNDTYGHQVGDLQLKAAVEAIVADGAIVGRYGGDEFVVLLPETSRAAAELYQRRALKNLALARVSDPNTGASVPVVASVGLAMFPDDATGVRELIEIADAAMYAQKRARKESQATSLVSVRGLGDERAAKMIGELVPLLTSPASISEKLRLVSHRLSIGTGYDAVNIDVYDMQNDELAAHNAFAKTSDELLEAWSREQETVTNHPIGEILSATKLPVLIDDIPSDPRLTEVQRTLLNAVGLLSGISVPMLWDNEVVGVLSVGSKEPSAFNANDAKFLMTVATQVTAIVRLSSMVEELRTVSDRMVEARAETVMMLAASAESGDAATGTVDHLQNVRDLAEAIAVELGYSQADAQELGLAAALHDIGKVAVAESMLNAAGAFDAAGALNREQWRIMQTHTVRGAEFLSKHTSFFVASIVARHHHERWDGTGYPDGLKGDAIPEAAAIVTVADSFDAMTTERPYRVARSLDEAIDEIVAGRGTQFSPRVVDALLRLHGRGYDEQNARAAA